MRFMILLIAVGFVTTDLVYGQYGGGSGDPNFNDPFILSTSEHLHELTKNPHHWDNHFILISDIDMSGYTYQQALFGPDTDSSGIYNDIPFTGIFDGNGHTIKNISIIPLSLKHNLGLFGCTDRNAKIMNLTLKNCKIESNFASFNVGCLIGKNSNASITNCFVSGFIHGYESIGGLIGYNLYGIVNNCHTSCRISGQGTGDESAIGGLVGQSANNTVISNCSATGIEILACDTYVGGLVGMIDFGTIFNCYSTGKIESRYIVGGLVGISSYSTITNCYSNASVFGDTRVGGLVGYNYCGEIGNCYATCYVEGLEDIGGLLGGNGSWFSHTGEVINSGIVTNCFWDTNTQIHGVIESIGLNEGTVINVYGLSTSQLHQQFTFTDWDFINVWDIGENQTYPYLRTHSAADINKDKVVNLFDLSIMSEQWMREQCQGLNHLP